MALGSVITERTSKPPAVEVRLNIEHLRTRECRHPGVSKAPNSQEVVGHVI